MSMQRVQWPGEHAETFITHHALGINLEENIRDRIVVAFWKRICLKRLQLVPDLTLEMAVLKARQSDEVKARVSQQGEQTCAIQEVAQGHGSGAKPKWRCPQRDRHQDCDSNSDRRMCGPCSKTPHRREDECPARSSTCNRCGKGGPWERVCKSRRVSEVTEDEGQEEEYYLGSVNGTPHNDDEWTVTLNIDSLPVDFFMETGADCSIINENVYKALQKKRVLQRPKKVLSGPGGGLNCLGQFITPATRAKHTHSGSMLLEGRT